MRPRRARSGAGARDASRAPVRPASTSRRTRSDGSRADNGARPHQFPHDARPEAPLDADRPPDATPHPTVKPDVDYKGAPLDADKGPGLGCFWLQIVVLAVVVVLTPLSAAWEWPIVVTIVLLATTLVLLLFVGQTIIFLLRLVAADRRSDARRRPLQSRTKTVGELEDEARAPDDAEVGRSEGPGDGKPPDASVRE